MKPLAFVASPQREEIGLCAVQAGAGERVSGRARALARVLSAPNRLFAVRIQRAWYFNYVTADWLPLFPQGSGTGPPATSWVRLTGRAPAETRERNRLPKRPVYSSGRAHPPTVSVKLSSTVRRMTWRASMPPRAGLLFPLRSFSAIRTGDATVCGVGNRRSGTALCVSRP